MPGFSFADRRDIEDTIRLVEERRDRPPKPKHGTGDPAGLAVKFPTILTHGFIYKTPAGGIPARTGTTPGTADCTPFFINSSGDLEEMLDNDGNTQTHEIINIFQSAIGASVYITAKRVFNALIADAEDCPAA